MNKQFHRIVFNRARGALIAVQETASSVSGGASGQTEGQGAGGMRLAPSVRHSLAHLAWAFGLTVWMPLALAQTLPVTASPGAPANRHPIVDAAGNGVPVVHIAPPSAAGVSRNSYQDFNVNSNGLILNNSASNVQTQLGGWITGNPQLGYVPAKLIVNEVLGTGASTLKGTIEVAGQRADVVIANPNGLLCDGCGFLNTGRATLTTGTPQYGAQGQLGSFSVTQGQLTVGTGGLNASNLEQLDLIARGLVVQGGVWARKLNVLAGANAVPYASTQDAVSQPGSAAAPLFAIDIRALGALYADQIYLVATDKGLGVNSTGRIAALQGNLQLSANGDLTLKDTYAAGDMSLSSAGNLTLDGQTQTPAPANGIARGDAIFTARGTFANSGTVDVAGSLAVTAGAISNAGSLIQRGSDAPLSLEAAGTLSNSGSLYSAGDLQLSAGSLVDTGGVVQTERNLGVTAATIALTGTQLDSGAALSVHAERGDATGTAIRVWAGSSATLSATGALSQTGSELQAQGDMALQGATITTSGSAVIAGDRLNVTTAGQLDNSGGSLSGVGAVAVIAGSVVNDAGARGAVIASDGTTQIVSSGATSNRGGVISAKTALTVQALAMDNTGGSIASDGASALALASLVNAQGVVSAGSRLDLEVQGALDNTAGLVQSGAVGTSDDGSASVRAGSIDNQNGEILGRDALSVSTAGLHDDGGVIASTNASLALSSAAASNRGGMVSGATGLSVSSAAFDNSAGLLQSGGDLTVDTHAHSFTNTAGAVVAADSLTLRSGTLTSNADAAGTAGQIAAGGNLALNSAALSNDGSTLSAFGTLDVDTGGASFSNTGGAIDAGGALDVHAGALGNRGGHIASNEAVELAADSIDNASGVVTASHTVSIASGGAVSNVQGRILSDSALQLAATQLDNGGGSLSADQVSITLGGGALVNEGGSIVAARTSASTLTLQSGHIDNRGGTLATSTALAIDSQGQDFDNAGGLLQADGALDIRTAHLDNTGGRLTSLQSTHVNASAGLSNDDGEISAARVATNAASSGDVTITASGPGLSNQRGAIVAEGALSLQSTNVDNSHGTIAADSAATLAAASLSNHGGSVQSVAALSLHLDALDNAAAGQLLAGAALTLDGFAAATSQVNNAGGLISAHDALAVTANSLNNDAGRMDAGATTALTVAGSASNRGGAITSTTGTSVATQALDNSAGEISSAAALSIDTHQQTLVNQSGALLAGADLTLRSGSTTNQLGTIAANGALDLQTGALDNSGGSIQAGTSLLLDTQGANLVNQGSGTHEAVIAAAGTVTLRTGQLSNLTQGTAGATITAHQIDISVSGARNSGTVAALADASVDGQLRLAATGAVDNSAGTLQAQGSISVSAQSLANQGGRIVSASASGATAPSLSITTTGALDNSRHGLLAAFNGDATLNTQGGTFSNATGGVAYSRATLTLNSGTVDNSAGGSLLSDASFSAATAGFNNDAGLVQAGSLSIDTQGQTLTNTHSSGYASATGSTATGGLQAASDLHLTTGALRNAAGDIDATAGTLTVTAGSTVDNGAGLLAGGQGVSVTASGSAIGNAAGHIQSSGGDVRLQSATVTNDGGTIASTAGTALEATASISNRSGSIAGLDVVATTTGTLDNTGGRLTADRDATISAARLDNTSGQISARRDLGVTATAFVNDGGSAIANRALSLSTASSSVTGTLAASDLTLDVQGDFGNTASLSATHDLTINAQTITNSGTLHADNTLSANATGNMVNTVSGELSGANVQLSAQGSIDNQGLINSTADGGHTLLQAGTISNSGRIYGDEIDLVAGTIGNSGSGAIAARSTLNLAGQDISNSGSNALLLSLGNLNAGASFATATGRVSGTALRFANTAGRVEADGDLGIAATTITNANGGVRTAMATTGTPTSSSVVIPSGSTQRFPASQCVGIGGGQDDNYCILHPEVYGQRQHLAAAWDTVTTNSPDSGFTTSQVPHYAWNDPVFAKMGVATAGSAPPTEPAGGCTSVANNDSGSVVDVNSPACNQWRTDSANWTAAYTASLNNLQAAITPYNASVDADNATVHFEDYTLIQSTTTTQQTQVTASAPGQLLSGGNLVLSGTSITNTDSRIVAGGSLYVNGQTSTGGTQPVTAGIRNISTTGQQIVTESGTTQFTHVDTCGSWPSEHHCRNWDGTTPYTPAPTTTTIDLATVVFQQNAAQLQGGTAAAGSSAARTPNASGVGSLSGNARVLAGAPAAHVATPGVASIDAPDARNSAVVVHAAVATTVHVAGSGAAGASTALPPVQRVLLSSHGTQDVVLTVAPRLSLPGSQLFQIQSAPSAKFLVETDPAFTNYRNFLSSDYFEQQLALDPGRQLKRYGDGYAEQRLVDDQVLALTGRRYLSGYSSTEGEYKALMDAGVAFAKAYQLAPGVSLTAEQMAELTTDIVWLTTQTVTLPDGSTQQVLVPQVYLRRPQAGDLAPSGALMAGTDVQLSTPGELVNSGSIRGDTIVGSAADITNTGHVAARQDLLLSASNDLKNLSGTLSADGVVSLQAGRDLVVQTRVVDTSAAQANGTGASSSQRSAVDRLATVQAGQDLLMQAGRDMQLAGAQLASGADLQAVAGRDLTVHAVQGSYTLQVHATGGTVTQGRSTYLAQSQTTRQTSDLNAGGNLTLVAQGGSLAATGANLDAAQDVALQGESVNIAGAKTSASIDNQTAQRSGYERAAATDEGLAGGNVNAGGNLTVIADGTRATGGSGDITVSGANLSAQSGATTLQAAHDVNVQALLTEHVTARDSYYSGGTLLTHTTRQSSSTSASTQAEAGSIGGSTVAISAGHDATIAGSDVVADHDLSIHADYDLNIVTSAQTSDTSSAAAKTTSGLMGSGVGVMAGHRTQTQLDSSHSTEQVGSTVGSVGGNVTLTAGNQFTQTGSAVQTPAGNVDVLAQKIQIDAATNTGNSHDETHFKQSGLTLALSSPLISTLQSATQTAEAAGKTKNGRMQALAGAQLALNAKGAASGAAQAMGGAGGAQLTISLTVGSSRSDSSTDTASSTAQGSSIGAGGHVNLVATGAGQDSTLTVTGSDIQAGTTAHLKADGAITLEAANNSAEQHSRNSSSSAAAGVAVTVGQQGASFGVTASASLGRGHADGTDSTWTNTHVSGQQVQIDSGGDTTLKGAVVQADQVSGHVGGNLTIQSLQDTSTYDAKQENMGGSVTAGAGFSGSVNYSKSQVNANYASVSEQSGVQAGDGGFQLDVKGGTSLQGGVIASSQAAVDGGKNHLSTQSITASDIANTDSHDASGFGVALSYSSSDKGQQGSQTQSNGKSGPGFTGGIGQSSGSQASTTVSGISDATITLAGDGQSVPSNLDRSVTSGQGANSLGKGWDGQQLMSDVQAQVTITQNALPRVASAIGTAMDQQAQDLRAQAAQTIDPSQKQALLDQAAKYDESGEYRIAAHAALGALGGGLQGAVGAGAASASAQTLNDLQSSITDKLVASGMSPQAANDTAKALTGTAATAIGAATAGGSTAGTITAANADFNNRQLHATEAQKLAQLKRGQTAQEQARLDAAACYLVHCADGVPASDLNYGQLKAMQDAGASYTQEQSLLAATGEFTYSTLDPARDLVTRNGNLAQRAGGAVNLVAGALGTATGASITGAGAVACPETGISCAAVPLGVAVAASSYQQAKQGNEALFGSYTSTEGQRVLDSFSPQAYPGERDPLKTGAVEAAKAAVIAAGGKYIPAGLAAAEDVAANALDKAATDTLLKSAGAIDPLTGQALLDMRQLTTAKKGVAGELFGSNLVKQIVPDGTKLARMPGVGETGIDDLYKVDRPDVDYVNIEYKFVGTDSKTGAQALGKTADGVQGSESWLTGSDRVEKSVGSVIEADKIRDAIKAGRTETWVVTTRADGSTELQVLDSLGKPKPIDTSKIILPSSNFSGAKP